MHSLFGLDGALIKSINYAFDAENRLQARHEQSSNQSTGNALSTENSLEYDELNRLVNVAGRDGQTGYLSHNGVRTQREFHADGSIK